MNTKRRPLTAVQVKAVRECMARYQGLSACSIVHVLVPKLRDFADGMTGYSGPGGYPCDPDDFSRCRRVLALIPDGVARISEVAEAYPFAPEWRGLADCWPELEALWLEEENNLGGRMPKLYARMQKACGVKPRAGVTISVAPARRRRA